MIFYSMISLWEIEIKHILHPDEMTVSSKDIDNYCAEAGFVELRLKNDHIFKLSALHRKDTEKNHKDPFDRILLCQAISENMNFLTHDRLIGGYDAENVILVG